MKIYVSHPIRGLKGKDASENDIVGNLFAARVVAGIYKDWFPNIDFYVPAEHHDFINRAYEKGYLSIQQILEIDCDILKECDGVIFHNPEDLFSHGMAVEKIGADRNKIPHIVIYGAATLPDMRNSIEKLIDSIKESYGKV